MFPTHVCQMASSRPSPHGPDPPPPPPALSALGKHALQHDLDKSKRVKRGLLLPTEAQISALHTAIQNINENHNWYSNPANLGRLPFLHLYNQLPVDRFDFNDNLLFTYMGRESFAEVWSNVKSLKSWQGTRLDIEGTIGYGKSYILAALAAFLSRSGKRPVYIPDCWELLKDDVPYIQSALLSAFSEPSSTSTRDDIRAFESHDDIIQFCGSLPHEKSLYFIIDQKNALDREDDNKGTASNDKKQAVSTLLDKIARGHLVITSASANYQTALEVMSRHHSERTLSLRGGMSRIEMDHWWQHYFSTKPDDEARASNIQEAGRFEPDDNFTGTISFAKAYKFEPDDKGRIEYLTGCIPLLLRPVLTLSRSVIFEHVDEFEERMLRSRELRDVGMHVRAFAKMKRDKSDAAYQDHILAVYKCLTSSAIRRGQAPLSSIDHQYFYFDGEGVGHCTCGISRDIAATVLRNSTPEKFLDTPWLDSVISPNSGNPSVNGYAVELSCLSAIEHFGLHYGKLQWDPIQATTFDGDIFNHLPINLKDSRSLFIPDHPYSKHIDALYLAIDVKAKTVFVAPIQVTIGKRPKRQKPEPLFYANWARWQVLFYRGFRKSTTSVWIVDDIPSWEQVEGKWRDTTSGVHAVDPSRESVAIPVANVYQPLADVLARSRGKPWNHSG
ncbi:hypothetical protein D9615_005699 [Tricholomella constricta]|uniref:Uncharacterized protein n=1 Tax=Tricholomella constricta TaxID=117010 RepID=A0A8H5HAH8_9AGAR|nr:hypothetical protein D9615_005699 [Tricholomella constricta]